MATVLLVDDEPDLLDALAELLRAEGHAVLAAPDGLAALALLDRTTPDLVVTDAAMPRLDGPGLVRRLRAGAAPRALPVVMTSALPPPDLEGLGPVAFLRKPFGLDDLLDAVAAALPPAGP